MKKILGPIILILALFGDLYSKHIIVSKMSERDSIPVIENFFHITYVQNKGVAFGMLYGKVALIIAIGIIAVIGITYYIIKNLNTLSAWTIAAMMLILAGALGNLYDRAFRGFVVDFIDFRGIWSYIFNIADTYINIGAGIIILESLIQHNKKKSNNENKEESK